MSRMNRPYCNVIHIKFFTNIICTAILPTIWSKHFLGANDESKLEFSFEHQVMINNLQNLNF